ncbi:MAG: DUF4384 domain-containing protein [Anaerolineae bacterium]|nr:DUF4384 domain-containing protein [Gemmatimonadaceae bacterium]
MLDFASALLAATTLVSSAPIATDARQVLLPHTAGFSRSEPPSIRLWLASDDVLRYGERADVYFRADDDAFVAVVRIDTDGRMHLLYPESEHRSGRIRGGRTYQASPGGYGSFTASEPAGLGFIFAMVSHEPFDFGNVGLGNRSHFAGLGRVGGDPFFAIEELANRLLDGGAAYALDYVEYHVGRRANYPRYVNYDCYAGRISIFWNPFSYRCRDYHVAYHDSYYYSNRYYSGRHVVYVREPRRPHFDFKTETSAGGGSNESSVGYRGREDSRDYRRPGSPASDPNIPLRSSQSNPGATRPGDDVSTGIEGRRRVIVPETEDRDRTGPDARPPRRDDDDRRDNDDQSSPNTPRRDDRKSEPRNEPASDREQTQPRRSEPSTDRRSPPSAERRPRSKDAKPAQPRTSGESRKRRTPE